jgi:exosortase
MLSNYCIAASGKTRPAAVSKGYSKLHKGEHTAINPWLIYGLWTLLCGLIFLKPLKILAQYALHNDNASHILLVPAIVAWLLHADRSKISRTCAFDYLPALLFVVPAVLLGGLALRFPLAPLSIGSLILFLAAGYIAVFGRVSAKQTWFPFAFLAFAIPLPEALLNRFIYALQYASAAVAGWIFDWSGVPVLREGFIFHLPGLSIEVAKECSGIRSSIALVLLALLVAHFAFNSIWKKAVFVFAGLLMMAVKNGVRIATLTILAKYVDPDFLFGRLHHEGGIVFFLIGLGLLAPLYWLLRRGEKELPVLAATHPTVPRS